MVRVTTLIAVAAALLLVASGCGGGSKKSSAGQSSGSTATTTTTGSSSSSGSSSSGSSTGSSSSNNSSNGSSSGAYGSGSSSKASKSCLDFAGAASKLGGALAAGFSASQNGRSLKTYFDALAEKAPSDIKASFQTLATAISKYVDEIQKLNLKPGKTPTADQVQKIQAAVASIGTPAVQAASNKIQAWVNAGCHS